MTLFCFLDHRYMKYLYEYECFREKLSTRSELQAAIDGNRREGRRSSYGYTGNGAGNESIVMQRNPPNSLALQMPLPLVAAGGQHHMPQSLNGSAAHTPLPHHPHHPHYPQVNQGPNSGKFFVLALLFHLPSSRGNNVRVEESIEKKKRETTQSSYLFVLNVLRISFE